MKPSKLKVGACQVVQHEDDAFRPMVDPGKSHTAEALEPFDEPLLARGVKLAFELV